MPRSLPSIDPHNRQRLLRQKAPNLTNRPVPLSHAVLPGAQRPFDNKQGGAARMPADVSAGGHVAKRAFEACYNISIAFSFIAV